MAKVAAFVGYGLGGRAWSAGMEDLLAKKLRALGVYCPDTYQWTDWQQQARDIRQQQLSTKIVITGHSMDANELPNIAAAAGRMIDLLVGYDPTIWYACPLIPSNVKQAILFHGVNWLNPIGHARYGVVDASKTKLVTYNTSDLHTDIDDDNGLHGITIAAVKALLAA